MKREAWSMAREASESEASMTPSEFAMRKLREMLNGHAKHVPEKELTRVAHVVERKAEKLLELGEKRARKAMIKELGDFFLDKAPKIPDPDHAKEAEERAIHHASDEAHKMKYGKRFAHL